MMSDYKYDAFISYSSADARSASRIQRYLEKYRLPDDAERRLRVFLDYTDLRSGHLSSELEQALAQSRTLIVCCSRSAADAEWVELEIDAFRTQDSSRDIVLLLLAGEAETAVPASLRSLGLHYADLRRGWIAGRMRPRSQIELVRAIATIADTDLPSLVSWDTRRRLKNTVRAATSIVLLAMLTLLFPFDYTRTLTLSDELSRLNGPEYCDVSDDGRLLIAARERSGDDSVNDVMLFSNVLGDDADAWNWLDEVDYVPRRRLLHSHAANPAIADRIGSALDIAAVESRADALAAELEDQTEYLPDGPYEVTRLGLWLGEPAPGLSCPPWRSPKSSPNRATS